MMLKAVLATVLYCSFFVLIDGSHYRGGSISWKPQYPHLKNQNPVPILLQQRHVWQRENRIYCDHNTIIEQTPIGDNAKLKCISSMSVCQDIPDLGPTDGPCIAYSVINDWSATLKFTLINISTNISFEAAYQGANWLLELGAGGRGSWSISTEISTMPRSDGTYNTPPFVAPFPIKLVPLGETSIWAIPVADTDGDIVRCRWARNGPPDECSAVCGAPPHASLNEQTCTITYTANTMISWAIALKIEDFESSSSTTPLSGASLQFIVEVYFNDSACKTPPSYMGVRPPGSCIPLKIGDAVNDIAQFVTKCPNVNFVEVETYLPPGMIASAVARYPLNSSLYAMVITWTPTLHNLGVHFVCYTPFDSENRQGQQACVKYFVSDDLVDQTSHHYISGSMGPSGVVESNTNIWRIQYTASVVRPTTTDAFIRFYSKSTAKEVYSINVRTNRADVKYSDMTLSFHTRMTWTEGEEYYILLDRSLVTDPSVCGPPSPNICDPNFWTFQVPKRETSTSSSSMSSVTPSNSIFDDYCNLFQPCINGDTCQKNETVSHGYKCPCSQESQDLCCQLNHRRCPMKHCWNGGVSHLAPQGEYNCSCPVGWQGRLCETKANYCLNITCQNQGVHRPVLGACTCACLDNSYSGLFCEITANKIRIHQILAKLIVGIALFLFLAFVMFIITMDILTYGFGIDPAQQELERIQQKKREKNRKPKIERVAYVHVSPTDPSTETLV